MNNQSQSLRTRGRRVAGVFVSAWMCGLWPATSVTPLAEAADPGLHRIDARQQRRVLRLEDLVTKRPAVVLSSKPTQPVAPVAQPASDLFEVVDKPSPGVATISQPVSPPAENLLEEVNIPVEVSPTTPVEPAAFPFESSWEQVRHSTGNDSGVVQVSAQEVLPSIDPAIQALISELTHKDHEIRQMAAFMLGETGGDAQVALPALRQSMFSNYTMVRLHAAEAVAKLSPGDEAAYETLLRGLEDNNSEVRVMAATALIGVAPVHQARALEVLESLRFDASEQVRSLAETALPIEASIQPAPMPQEDYELPTRTVQPTSQDFTVNSVSQVEELASPHPVNDISSQVHVEPQADAFDEHFAATETKSSPKTTLFAAEPAPTESVSSDAMPSGDASVTSTLPPEFAELAKRLGSADPIQQKYALSELVWFGADAQAVLPHVQACLTSNDEVVRAHAAKALHDISPNHDQQAIAVLAELVQSLQPGVSPLAAYFLGEFDSEAFTALPVLRRAMSESVGMDQLHIAEAVLRIEPQDVNAAIVLTRAVSDADESNRFFATCALVAAAPHQDEIVVPALFAAQNDASARVRMAADTTLTGYQTEPKGVAAVVIAEPEPAPVVVEEVPEFDPVVVEEVAEIETVTDQQSPFEATVIETETLGTAKIELAQVEVPAPQTKSEPEQPTEVIPPEFDTNLPVKPWTAQTPGEAKPIRYVTINTAPKRRDADGRLQELPTNYGAAYLEKQGQTQTGQESRSWIVTGKAYEAPAYCHRPIYFEDVNLERYGHHFHCVQPLVSAAHFFGRVPFLPYLATVSKPWECEYPLGKYRPGSNTPYQYNYVPLQADAVLVQAGMTAVPFFIIH